MFIKFIWIFASNPFDYSWVWLDLLVDTQAIKDNSLIFIILLRYLLLEFFNIVFERFEFTIRAEKLQLFDTSLSSHVLYLSLVDIFHDSQLSVAL